MLLLQQPGPTSFIVQPQPAAAAEGGSAAGGAQQEKLKKYRVSFGGEELRILR